MDNENPFAALLQSTPNKTEKSKQEAPARNLLEDVFGFTLVEEIAEQNNLVYLRDLAEMFPQRRLDVEILEHALFERLLLEDEFKIEKVLLYLYECYSNIGILDEETRTAVKAIILRNIITSLKQPDLYPEQNVNQQLFNLMQTDFSSTKPFFEDLYSAFENDEGEFISQFEDLSNCYALQMPHNL